MGVGSADGKSLNMEKARQMGDTTRLLRLFFMKMAVVKMALKNAGDWELLACCQFFSLYQQRLMDPFIFRHKRQNVLLHIQRPRFIAQVIFELC